MQAFSELLRLFLLAFSMIHELQDLVHREKEKSWRLLILQFLRYWRSLILQILRRWRLLILQLCTLEHVELFHHVGMQLFDGTWD